MLSPSSSEKKAQPAVAHRPVTARFRITVGAIMAALLVVDLLYTFDRLPNVRHNSHRIKAHGGSELKAEPLIPEHKPIDWSRFAYTQYATDSTHLCNSVMFFDRLHQLKSKASRVLMYPEGMLDKPSDDAGLLFKARDDYGVELVPFSVETSMHKTWPDSFSKLLVFNQTQYDRVLAVDSDSLMLQNLDHLFLAPPTPLAVTRAYWLYPELDILASNVMLVEPSPTEFSRVQDAIHMSRDTDTERDVINKIYGTSAMVLPHRQYALLTSEFRREDHMSFLRSKKEKWDPMEAYNSAKLVHFSDWPVPKPWLEASQKDWDSHLPKCEIKGGMDDCTARDLWTRFYKEFRERRQNVCGAGTGR